MRCFRTHPLPTIQHHFTPVGLIYRSLNLFVQSHEPRQILLGVGSFVTEPDYAQEYYKRDFVRIYKRWMGRRTPDPCGAWELELERDLFTAMVALDAFFFAGSLIRPGPYAFRGERLAKLEAQNNIFDEGEIGHKVYLESGLSVLLGATASEGGGKVTIYIDTLANGSLRTVKSIFETLVHEMAHAIFDSFVCDSDDCEGKAADPSVLGQHGHGLMWVDMADSMRRTIQQWDVVLADFYDTDDIHWCNKELN